MTTPGIAFGIALDMGPEAGHIARRIHDVRPLLRVAEEHGFDSVWLGESYRSEAVGFHTPAPLLTLATLAEHTSLRLGTGVTLLPAWHPVRLAYDAALLDQLCGGRLSLGIGLGGPDLWRRFGIDRGSVGGYVDESLATMQALWSGDTGVRGQMFSSDQAIFPLPVQEGGPPLFIGGKIRRSLQRAARFGSGYYASTSDVLGQVERQSQGYRQELEACGRDPKAAVVGVNRLTIVAEESNEATRLGELYAGKVLSHYAHRTATPDRWQSVRKAPDVKDGEAGEGEEGDHLFRRLAADLCLVGTPEQVATQVQRYAEVGVTRIFARVAPADMPIETALVTLELLGRDVLPRFRPGP